MKIKFKDFLKKASEVDPKIVAIFSVFIVFAVFFSVKNESSFFKSFLTVAILIPLVISFYKYGVSVLKNIATIFLILYITSIYTSIVGANYPYVIEPFFFTIGASTVFLSFTYNENNPQWNLRSRRLSVIFLLTTLISIKSALIIEGFSFMFSEIIGLNYLVLYVILWRLFVNHGKKTKITLPIELERKEMDSILVIKVEENLEKEKKKYLPYLYKEVFIANQKGYNIIFISNSGSDRVFSLENIKINNKKVLFVLQEDSKEEYLKSTAENLIKEISAQK